MFVTFNLCDNQLQNSHWRCNEDNSIYTMQKDKKAKTIKYCKENKIIRTASTKKGNNKLINFELPDKLKIFELNMI